MSEASVEELKSDESPDLESINPFFDAEAAKLVKRGLLEALILVREDHLEEENPNVENKEPFGNWCAIEVSRHARASGLVARLHVFTIIISHAEDVAVIGQSGK